MSKTIEDQDGSGATGEAVLPALSGSAWINGYTGVGSFDGSIQVITRRASDGSGEQDEGWSTAIAASGVIALLQTYDRAGNVTRIPMTKLQVWELKVRLEAAAMEIARNEAILPNDKDQAQNGRA